MWKLILLLIFTLIVVPILAFSFDDPLTLEQKAALMQIVSIYLIAALACFLISTISKNYSQVDKLWSLIPIVYVWVVCWNSGFESRMVLMSVLVTIWGLRLTYNFSRRGGYSLKFWEGEEDYRWAVVRSKPEFQAPWKWVAFNFFFISFYQMGLILLFTLPIVKSMDGSPLSWVDYLLAGIFILFVVLETIADQQQWTFQNEKYKQLKNGEKLSGMYEEGFLQKGLWGIVRHPNYSAELAIWIVFYLFSVAATGNWINWSIVGSLLLILLFFGSSNLSESISSGKYPDYKNYQKRVPRFVPSIFKSNK